MVKDRKRVLIAYDGSTYADAVLEDLPVAGLPREADALIVTVSDGLLSAGTPMAEVAAVGMTPRRVTSAIVAAKDQALRLYAEAKGFATKASRRVRSHFEDWNVSMKILEGSPSQKLLQEADRWKPDLIVVGSHGHSAFKRFILGSVSNKLASQSRSSVRVVRRIAAKDRQQPHRIMIAVDGSPGAKRTVEAVGRRVWTEGTLVKIVVVNGVAPRMIRDIFSSAAEIQKRDKEANAKARAMAEWAAEQLDAIGLQVSVVVLQGEPEGGVIVEAEKWKADSIFVSAHISDHLSEQGGLGGLSAALVNNALCTVEVVR